MPKDSGGFDYEYFIKDHLGNTRLTVQDSSGIAAIKQEDHYYPFGMVMNGQSWQSTNYLENRYLYNGKEFQDELGLDWYDYGARFYDAQIGRWHSVDAKCEKYISITPYNYVANSPIRLIDPNGKEIYWGGGQYGGDRFTGADAQNLFRALQSRRSNIFFGNEAQVANIMGNPKNANWVAFHTKDVIRAKELLHVLSIKITSLYIGGHSGGASMRLVPNPDDEGFDWMAKGQGNDNYRFSPNTIEQYDNPRNDNTWKDWYKVVSLYFEAFKSMINMISDEGSLIIGGCRAGSGNGVLLNAIYEWSSKKINIFGNIDQTSDNPNVLDNPISMGVDSNGNKYHYEGWGVIGPKSGGKFLTLRTSGNNTGQIRLQSTGEPVHIVTKDE